MALQKLYRKPGKKYKTELRPSRIDIYVLPLLICFVISVVVWCYATGHSRPEPGASDTTPPYEETADTPEAPADGNGESLPADGEAHPSDV